MGFTNDLFETTVSNESSSFRFLIFIIMILALVSCSDSSSSINNNDENNYDTSPGPGEVWMVDQSFIPSTLEVEVGTVVTWTNKSELVHTVTSGTSGKHDGTFDSGEISPGETYTYTFSEDSTNEYFCTPHQPSMSGRVTVRERNTGY